MAATRAAIGLWHRLLALLGSLLGVLAPGVSRAVDLPGDKAEALLHSYIGGGVNAYGPAVLVRKSIMDKVSLSGTYYMDAVSNASIDVVTTASKYNETRHEFGLNADYVYRDAQITIGAMTSHEPDYVANTGSIDVTQEVFGGMTTVAFGYTHASDKVSKKNSPEFSDTARHWQYRPSGWVTGLPLGSSSAGLQADQVPSGASELPVLVSSSTRPPGDTVCHRSVPQ